MTRECCLTAFIAAGDAFGLALARRRGPFYSERHDGPGVWFSRRIGATAVRCIRHRGVFVLICP